MDNASLTAIFWLAFICAAYLLPTLIAMHRKHRQTAAIAALNILLGWSVLGWMAAFVWALVSPPAPQTIVIHTKP